MKTIHDYDREELLALTTEEIERHVDLECADRGVKLLPPKPTPPEPLGSSPDLTCYQVKAGELIFLSRDEAEEVVELLSSLRRHESYYLEGRYAYSGPKGVKPVEEPNLEVTVATYWSPEEHERNRAAIEAHKGARQRFEEGTKAYDAAFKERENVASEIYNVVEAARKEEREEEWLLNRFKEYLDLADRDAEVAIRFLLKAYANVDEGELRDLIRRRYAPCESATE